MTYHYHGIDAEESILTKSLPNLGTWALPNLFFLVLAKAILFRYSSHHRANPDPTIGGKNCKYLSE